VPEKVVVNQLLKAYGSEPGCATDPLRVGQSKNQRLQKTGLVVGVADASFTVNAHEIFVLVGLSGSGKSTHWQMLLDWQDVAALAKKALITRWRKYMGMVFQPFALLPDLPVFLKVPIPGALPSIMLDRTTATVGGGQPRRSWHAKLGIGGRASEVDKA